MCRGWLAWLAGVAVHAVPREAEEKLGRAILPALAPPSRLCRDEAVAKVLSATAQRLVPASPYRFELHVLRDPTVNAFALPGGPVVIHSALWRRLESPEELAGLLSHEMQHVLQRHSTRALLRELSLGALLTLLTGDLSTAQLLTGFGDLSFQRGDEEQADRLGVSMLRRARVDPHGMVRLLRTLHQDSADLPGALRYLSTHPLTQDRLRIVESLARPTVTQPWVTPAEWAAARRGCAA